MSSRDEKWNIFIISYLIHPKRQLFFFFFSQKLETEVKEKEKPDFNKKYWVKWIVFIYLFSWECWGVRFSGETYVLFYSHLVDVHMCLHQKQCIVGWRREAWQWDYFFLLSVMSNLTASLSWFQKHYEF